MFWEENFNPSSSASSSIDKEEAKQSSTINRVETGLALAMTLEEQDSTFTMIASEEEDDEEDDLLYDCRSWNLEGELEFLEIEDLMYGDEIGLDELTYEELISLLNLIGEEEGGLAVTDIPKYLSPYRYQTMEKRLKIDRCVICQEEYEEGESLVALHCGHPYHSECISKWLQVRKICPVCTQQVSLQNSITC